MLKKNFYLPVSNLKYNDIIPQTYSKNFILNLELYFEYPFNKVTKLPGFKVTNNGYDFEIICELFRLNNGVYLIE